MKPDAEKRSSENRILGGQSQFFSGNPSSMNLRNRDRKPIFGFTADRARPRGARFLLLGKTRGNARHGRPGMTQVERRRELAGARSDGQAPPALRRRLRSPVAVGGPGAGGGGAGPGPNTGGGGLPAP